MSAAEDLRGAPRSLPGLGVFPSGAPSLSGSRLMLRKSGKCGLRCERTGERGGTVKRQHWRIALLAFVTFLLVLPALALDFPVLSGRVVDEANVLDPQTRAALADKLAELEAKTSDQLVVVTLKSLQGTSIEDFGVEVGRHWRIGQKDKNNGVLLIVAPNERKVRIEVGYGVEGALTDAVSRLIIENAITPRFRAGDFAGGITRGVDDIISVLTGDADEWKDRAAQRPDTVSSTNSTRNDSIWPAIWFVLVVMCVVFICVMLAGAICEAILRLLAMLSLVGGRGSSGGFSGGGGSFGGGGASGRW